MKTIHKFLTCALFVLSATHTAFGQTDAVPGDQSALKNASDAQPAAARSRTMDPLVERRNANARANAEYRASKSVSKEQLKAQKKSARQDYKAKVRNARIDQKIEKEQANDDMKSRLDGSGPSSDSNAK